jgi:hypothetical protein
MNAAIFALGVFALYLACSAVVIFIRAYRKPPPPQDIDREWLEK